MLNKRLVGLSLGREPVRRLLEPLEITFSHPPQPKVSAHLGTSGTLNPALHPPRYTQGSHTHSLVQKPTLLDTFLGTLTPHPASPGLLSGFRT